MFRALVRAYPWDLIDEGVADVLDVLHGQIGCDGLSVWAATPPVLQMRARTVEPRVFRSRGGLLFSPDESRYSSTRCKPVAADWGGKKDALERVVGECRARGLELRLVISASETGRLARRHREMACKNVFGAESHATVCLANPDVQAYLCCLLSELSERFAPDGICLTDFRIAWSEASPERFSSHPSLGDTERAFLGTCFCESCHQQAGDSDVDVAMAQRTVQVILQKSLDAGQPTNQPPGTILADTPPLAAYYRWRAAQLSSLLRRLTEVVACEVLLERGLGVIEQTQDEGLKPSGVAAVLTRITEPNQLPSVPSPGALRDELHVPASMAAAPRASEFVALLASAAKAGIAAVDIDHLGLLPESALTAVKQAVRFAKRSTDQ